MNPALPEPLRWSLRRWICSVGTVIALQVGLVFFLGQREQPLPERPLFRTTIQLAVDERSGQPPGTLEGLEDPALLALPNLRGFSGPAWLQFTPPDYQPEEWSEPPHWLALEDGSLSSTFSHFLATNTLSPPLVADKPLPPLPRFEPNFPNEPVPEQSSLRVEGELAARPLLARLELKSWPNGEMLSNSVVQAVVNAEGFTLSAVLLTSCGLKEADLYALKLASDARFLPAPRADRRADGPGRLTWGKLIFQWHTLPLPATNLSFTPP